MTTAEIVLRAPSRVDTLAATIREEQALAREAGVSMIEHAIRAGEGLIEAKRLVPRGEWEQWILDQFPDQNFRSVRGYMRLARHQEEVRQLQPANLNQAFLLLKDRKNLTYDPDLKEEVERLWATGEFSSCRSLAAHLGTNYYSVWRWLNPEKAARQRARARAQSKAGRRLLQRKEREAAVTRHGGPLAGAYTHIRKALQDLQTASETESNRDVRREIASAMQSAYNAEDRITKAVRIK